MGSSLAVLIIMAVALAGAPGEKPSGNVRLRTRGLQLKVERAVAGASRRLAQPACASILDEFADPAGRSLRSNLEAAGAPAEDYLHKLLFYDGFEDGRCSSRRVLAATEPGSSVVFVCARFYRGTFNQPDLAEVIVIHEALHTLGLGENPPSSSEITARVFKRCR